MTIGSLGLLTFAWLVQRLLPNHNAWQVLLGSTGIWLAVSLLLWQIRKRM
jgi:hypothetical protein